MISLREGGDESAERFRPTRIETNLRFAVLLLAAICAALEISEASWFELTTKESHFLRELFPSLLVFASIQDCVNELPQGVPDSVCGEARFRARVVWTVALTALVMGASVVLALGSSVIRRIGLRPIPELPGVRQDVIDPTLAAYGLTGTPILRRPLRPTLQARADGVLGRYVEVGTNWMAASLVDPPRARAVLAHECAHHAARDVFRARLSWWLGPVVLTWFGVYLAVVSDYWSVLKLEPGIRVAAAVMIALIARSAVLRAREHAADLDSARNDSDGLIRALSSGKQRRWWSRGPFQTHPSSKERCRALVDKSVKVSPMAAMLTGAVLGIAMPVLANQWRGYFSNSPFLLLASPVGWGIAGMLLGAWATLIVRAVAIDSPRDRASWSWFCLSVALGLSIGLSIFRVPLYFGYGSVIPNSTESWFAFVLLISVVLTIMHLLHPLGVYLSYVGIIRLLIAGSALGAILLAIVGLVSEFSPYADEQTRARGTLGLISVIHLFLGHHIVGQVLALVVVVSLVAVLILGRPQSTRDPVPRSLRSEVLIGGLLVGPVAAGCFFVYRYVIVGDQFYSLPHWYAIQATSWASPSVAIGVCITGGVLVGIHRGRAEVITIIGTCTVSALVVGICMLVAYALNGTGGSLRSVLFSVQGVVLISTTGCALVAGIFVTLKHIKIQVTSRSSVSGFVSSWAVSVGIFMLCVAGILALASQTLTAAPSLQEDYDHLAESTEDDRFAFMECGHSERRITPEGQHALSEAEKWLADPDNRPATTEILKVRDKYIELVAACRKAFDAAIARGSATVDPADAEAVENLRYEVIDLFDTYHSYEGR